MGMNRQQGPYFIEMSIRAAVVLLLIIMLAGCIEKNDNAEPSFAGESVAWEEATAALYFSTDLVHEKVDDGTGYLVLVDESGEFASLRSEGLEWNALIPLEGQLVLNQKEQLLLIDEQSQVERIAYEDCRVPAGYGQSSGTLDATGQYYALFNDRFTEDYSGYISKVRWGGADSHHCGIIEEYLEAWGDDEEQLYLISSGLDDPKELYFHTVAFQGEELVNQRTFLKEMETDARFMFTNLVPHDHYMYGIFAELHGSTVELQLMEIDIASKPASMQVYPLLQYPDDTTQYYFFNRSTLTVADGSLYFVDGFGDVYATDLEHKQTELQFHLQGYERQEYKQSEYARFQEERLHFFRFHETTGMYQLQTFDLSGKLERTVVIPELQEQIGRSGVFLYDFYVFEDRQ
ncbi:hypothetical protein DUZ99_03420 [Xylanibacillus composti]|uniref:Lipoprotein n=1 Tax=Xylanibacillus composti TaxID=1572762 RepID=A0A8J4H684_9BACL|nr:hypothetical protein [Xylanibacillus composti]MDT9724050.1 hypothetical protein [Xylanibacillus composti]GIQ69443.1 hypothetical protein XYCOK13_22670 [Xylanibacillus composti]